MKNIPCFYVNVMVIAAKILYIQAQTIKSKKVN